MKSAAYSHVIALLILVLAGKTLAGEFRILTSQTKSGGAFSSDFLSALSGDFDKNGTHGSNATTDLSLNRTYAGGSVPVDVYSVSTSSNVNASSLCAALTSTSSVGYCEIDVQVSTDDGAADPDDKYLPQQWDMTKVNVPLAWQNGFTGTSAVRVCVIDTGVDYTHPDIVGNLWVNPTEAAGASATEANGYKNGVDDDGDGIIDDIYGASFVSGAVSGDPMDQNGHGTFVAGVVGAVGNNAIGVTGVNQAVSIISCKFMDATGNGWVSDAIQCIDYCISKDAHILQNSWGGVDYSEALQKAVDSAEAHGTLFVASAGNEGVNTDTIAHYPSTMNNSNIVSVGASNSNDELWARSNYGKATVHVAAPGVSVLNLGLAGLYVKMTGTSMATPHVSGAAALILQKFLANGWPISTTTNQGLGLQLKQLIMTTAATMGTSDTAKLASGLLDTWEAIQHVPINPSSTSSSDSGTGFGDSTSTPATPEEANPFASSTATQSQEFQAAAGVAPSAGMTPVPASAGDTLIGTAIQQGAVAAINTSVTTSRPVFGSAQPVVFTPSGDALAPTTAPLDDALYHIEAPKAAPGMQGAPDAAPAPQATAADLAASAADLEADATALAADAAELAAAVQTYSSKAAGAGRKAML